MPKKKPEFEVRVASGTGEMVPVVDHRFDGGGWPFSFEVVGDEANTWLEYFSTECAKRGWSCSGIGELAAEQNNGTLTVRPQTGSEPLLDLVWKRKRGGALAVRARASVGSALSKQEVSDLLDKTSSNCRIQAKETFYRRGHLTYEGRAWRGEIWLSNRLRLGPPSRMGTDAVFGTRAVIVDALIDGISWSAANALFGVQLREIAAFLSVVMRSELRPPGSSETGWTWGGDSKEPEVRQLGYFEPEHLQAMPAPGLCQPVPLTQVARPILRPEVRFQNDDHQISLPHDIVDLWQKSVALPPEQRRQFIQVATLWQASLSIWRDHPSSSFTLMVAAGEALKPPTAEYRDRKIYDVIEGLLGRSQADALRSQWVRAHDTRSQHIHTGALKGWEFELHAPMSTYRDPSFRQAGDLLWVTVSAAIVEWLLRGGSTGLAPSSRSRRRGRRIMRRVGWMFGALLGGVLLGWFLNRQLG